MAIVTGVGGTGSIGTLSIQGQIIVSLLNDAGGTPGSLIAVLGVFTDADLVLGTNLLEIVLDLPITLTPNTRYWIQVTGNATTNYSWVQAGDDSGSGVADEFWYENDGTITTGANNAGPSFQMAILSEPSSGVYGTAESGSLSIELDGAIFGAGATAAVDTVQSEVDVTLVGIAAGGEAGDVNTSFASIAQPLGVHGTGFVGAVIIPGRIVVSLLSDSAGSPGTLITILGVYEDADLSLGTMLFEIDLSSAPIALTPNTRYWIEVSGSSFTSFSWVEAADPSGAGVATELWYEDIDGAVSTGANSAGPSFQMEVLAEPPSGVYASGGAGGLSVEVGGTISGVQSTGAAGTVAIPGEVHQPIDGVSGAGQSQNLAAAIAGAITDVSATSASGTLSDQIAVSAIGVAASGQAGIAAVTEALQAPVDGVAATGDCGSLTVAEAATMVGAPATSHVGSITTATTVSAVNVAISGVTARGYAGTLVGRKPVRKRRGGRGGQIDFKPALFSRPDRPKETEAEKLARYRKIVDDLLDLPPRQGEDTGQSEPDQTVPDFSFLASLEKPADQVSDFAVAEQAVPNWQMLAEQEDRLLLGDVLSSGSIAEIVRAEDDMLLSELLQD